MFELYFVHNLCWASFDVNNHSEKKLIQSN